MKVILRKRVDNLGERGDVVDVARGYARNSLIPKGLACPDTPGNRRSIEEEDRLRGRKDARERSAALALAKELADVSVTIAVKVGEEDRLYGSVTAADVERLLAEQGFKIDRRKIQIDEPIKQLGFYKVPIRLHRDVTVEIKLWVMKEST